MASAYWRTGHSLETLLKASGVGWNFLQLINLLLRQDDGTDEASVVERLLARIGFSSSDDADFPPSDVRTVSQQHDRYELTVAAGGLLNVAGPLPEPFVEWVADSRRSSRSDLADFLGLFDNRLQGYRYLVGRETRPGLMDSPAQESASGQFYGALAGYQGQLHPELPLTSLVADQRMSLPVVRHLLKFHFDLDLKSMESLVGGWVRVDDTDHLALGTRNSRLGTTAVLGRLTWDQAKGVALTFGWVSWKRAMQLIADTAHSRAFMQLLARIVNVSMTVDVHFQVRRSEIPPARLRSADAATSEYSALGQTTFLGGGNQDETVQLSLRYGVHRMHGAGR